MQKEQNILYVITYEDQDTQVISHCHFKNNMTREEKAHLIEALMNSVEELLKDGFVDGKMVRFTPRFRTKA